MQNADCCSILLNMGICYDLRGTTIWVGECPSALTHTHNRFIIVSYFAFGSKQFQLGISGVDTMYILSFARDEEIFSGREFGYSVGGRRLRFVYFSFSVRFVFTSAHGHI